MTLSLSACEAGSVQSIRPLHSRRRLNELYCRLDLIKPLCASELPAGQKGIVFPRFRTAPYTRPLRPCARIHSCDHIVSSHLTVAQVTCVDYCGDTMADADEGTSSRKHSWICSILMLLPECLPLVK
jgi:hypothetical protein